MNPISWWQRLFPARVVVAIFRDPLSFVRIAQPIGSVRYTNYPIEGLYRVVKYRDYSYSPGRPYVEVIGELMVRLSFGYPDDALRGTLIEQVINKEATFERGAGGRWTFAQRSLGEKANAA